MGGVTPGSPALASPAHLKPPRAASQVARPTTSHRHLRGNIKMASISAVKPTGVQARVAQRSVRTQAVVADGAPLDRKLRVAVIGGGPSGACAAETLAKGGCEVFLIERKMDNCKVSARDLRPDDGLNSEVFALLPRRRGMGTTRIPGETGSFSLGEAPQTRSIRRAGSDSHSIRV